MHYVAVLLLRPALLQRVTLPVMNCAESHPIYMVAPFRRARCCSSLFFAMPAAKRGWDCLAVFVTVTRPYRRCASQSGCRYAHVTLYRLRTDHHRQCLFRHPKMNRDKEKRMKKALLASILPLLLVAIAVCNVEAALLGPYSGTVVDAENGLPLKGATVVVFWGKATPTPAGAVGGFIEAAMCETGEDGKYKIGARLATIGLFSFVDGITFIAYQPGYFGFSRTFYHADPIGETRVIRLSRRGPIPIKKTWNNDFENDINRIDPDSGGDGEDMNPLVRLKAMLRGLPERELMRARTDWERLIQRDER